MFFWIIPFPQFSSFRVTTIVHRVIFCGIFVLKHFVVTIQHCPNLSEERILLLPPFLQPSHYLSPLKHQPESSEYPSHTPTTTTPTQSGSSNQKPHKMLLSFLIDPLLTTLMVLIPPPSTPGQKGESEPLLLGATARRSEEIRILTCGRCGDRYLAVEGEGEDGDECTGCACAEGVMRGL